MAQSYTTTLTNHHPSNPCIWCQRSGPKRAAVPDLVVVNDAPAWCPLAAVKYTQRFNLSLQTGLRHRNPFYSSKLPSQRTPISRELYYLAWFRVWAGEDGGV